MIKTGATLTRSKDFTFAKNVVVPLLDEEKGGSGSLVCEETIPGSSPDQKQLGTAAAGRRRGAYEEEEEGAESPAATPKREISSPGTPDSGQVYRWPWHYSISSSLQQCWGSVTFWCGSGSRAPYL